MEQIKAMLEAMEKDTAFGEEMQALMESGDTAGIIGLAAEKGFAFTEDDWQAYIDWGRSLTAAPVSKELAPEELENVVGGGGSGRLSDPYHSGCWFVAASGLSIRGGVYRRRCGQNACKALVPVTKIGEGPAGWLICGCWGTDKCVDGWHYEAGCK